MFYISTEALSFTFMNIYQYLILHKGCRKLYSDYNTRAINNRGGNRNINIEQPEQATLLSIFGGASRSQSLPPAKRSKRSGYYTITRSYYRKENAADMYMQDILQPKSIFFTVCMI